jgi:hypothetical protein
MELSHTQGKCALSLLISHDTKIMKNQTRSRTKFSGLEKQTNKLIIVVFFIEVENMT